MVFDFQDKLPNERKRKKKPKKKGVEEQVLDEMCPTGTEFWSGEKPESDKVINLTSILLSAKYEPLIIQHCC